MRAILAVILYIAINCTAAHAEMRVTSTDLTPGHRMPIGQVFNQFGCTGQNISPQLTWTDAPRETKSFAILAFDPNAPTGSGWWHWAVFNIPGGVTSVPSAASNANALPEGSSEGRTDFGSIGYGGACPPVGHGEHRYRFTVYALSVDRLPIDAGMPAAMVSYFVRASALEQASIEVTFHR